MKTNKKQIIEAIEYYCLCLKTTKHNVSNSDINEFLIDKGVIKKEDTEEFMLLLESIYNFINMKNIKQLEKQNNNEIKESKTQWVECSDKLPLCYISGDWDGRQSDLIIGETIEGKKFFGCCYEGFKDGVNFFDWYQVDEINRNDWMVNDTVSRWMSIPF